MNVVHPAAIPLQSQRMATTVAAPVGRRSGWRLALNIVIGLVLILAVAAAVGFVWFYRTAHASLAQLDGAIAVSGLAAPVSVARDMHGVPHLAAGSLEDLFFAQGYVTPQALLFHIDITPPAPPPQLAQILRPP